MTSPSWGMMTFGSQHFLNPPLTTVRAPEIKLGESAGAMLLQLINDKVPDTHQIYLPTELIIRDSCGAKTSLT